MRSRAFRPVGLPIYVARVPSAPLSLNSVEGFLKNFKIAGIANLFARLLNPFFLQRILRRSIGFVKHSEYAGERKGGEFIRGEFVGDVVAEFVLRSVVVFFLVNYREGAAFARVGGVERSRILQIARASSLSFLILLRYFLDPDVVNY